MSNVAEIPVHSQEVATLLISVSTSVSLRQFSLFLHLIHGTTQNVLFCIWLVIKHSACEIYPCCPMYQQLIIFTSVSSIYQYIIFDLCILLVMGIWVISSLGPLEVNILVRDFGAPVHLFLLIVLWRSGIPGCTVGLCVV